MKLLQEVWGFYVARLGSRLISAQNSGHHFSLFGLTVHQAHELVLADCLLFRVQRLFSLPSLETLEFLLKSGANGHPVVLS